MTREEGKGAEGAAGVGDAALTQASALKPAYPTPVYPRPAVAWAVVAALFVAYIFSFIDRMIIGLLVEPMKADLNISDTEISLLQGLAFALFYTIAGVPIGRLIDRSHRMRIVTAGITLWSMMTVFCGFASHYWQLFLLRIGVGVGEATLSPAAYSIISDSFPPKRLGIAMGVYGLGSAVGAGMAFMIGGAIIAFAASAGAISLPLIGEVKAWQATFIIVGAPGLLVALLFMVLPEPPRLAVKPEQAEQPPLSAVAAFLKEKAGAMVSLFFAVGMVNFAVFAAVSWLPVLYVRVHGFELAHAGYTAGAALIIGGLIGLVGGGWLSDKLEEGAPTGRVRLCGYAALIGGAAAVVFPLAGNPWAAAAAFVVFFSAAAVPIGAAASAIQQLTPNAMRATLSALYLFVVNLVGLGFGPTATALVSDIFFPFEAGIRYATAIVSPIGFWLAAWLFFVSLGHMRADAGAARRREDAAAASAP